MSWFTHLALALQILIIAYTIGIVYWLFIYWSDALRNPDGRIGFSKTEKENASAPMRMFMAVDSAYSLVMVGILLPALWPIAWFAKHWGAP